ncbi:MAG: hypothetical protein IKI41_07180 [Clostridia bacterium]|nr:hypothetical protein [Clostridia bacterium]
MDFIKCVNEGQEGYGGIPFWSWNDKLEPEELRRQIRGMHDLGMKGYFMHARGGLETEYLSDDWFECVDACIDEGKKIGMESWSYDENGWPSGFGGGIVLQDPKNFASYLTYQEFDEFPELKPENAPEVRPLSVYTVSADDEGRTVYTRTLKPVDGYDGKYCAVMQNYDSSYVDVLDEKVIAKFIECTHEEYMRRNPDEFGKAMPGFFTDEPQYYRYATPWSTVIPAKFREKYGYDPFDGLIAMFKDFDGAREFRYDYYYLCHELFIEAFPKQIYEWCDRNGAKLTGHAVEESALNGQMWCCGGVMPFYEFEHMPGMDYLGRNVGNDLAPKQLGSVAAQLGKKKVLTETFACCGWDVSPVELKRIADLQYASGINVMCHHLYAYSIRGQRKRDYPANYSEHLPWQNAFGDFVKYYNRLGFVLSLGEEEVNTLIIHPMHSAYLDYLRGPDRATTAALDDALVEIMNYFSDRQMSYHFGDEVLMRKYGKVEGNRLTVGKQSYKYVVLPKIYSLDGSTCELLKKFIANGGKVLLFDGAPDRIDGRVADLSWLKSNTTLEEIEKCNQACVRGPQGEIFAGVKLMTRNTPYGKLFYITNVSGTDYPHANVFFAGVNGLKEISLEEDDWNSGRAVRESGFINSNSVNGGGLVRTSFASGKSRLYIEHPENEKTAAPEKNLDSKENANCVKIDGDWKFTELPENQLTLDYACVSFDGGATYGEPEPVIRIFDELLRARYAGLLTLKFFFDVEDVPGTLRLCAEPLKYVSVEFNGEEIKPTGEHRLDVSFLLYDISGKTVKGRNEIVFRFDYFQRDYVYHVLYGNVMESLRNCLAFDTEVECCYLYGSFEVKTPGTFNDGPRNSIEYRGPFSLVKQRDHVDVSDLVRNGYPFYAGKIRVEKEFTADGIDAPELYVNGRFSYADVIVNGEHVKRLMFTNHCDISSYVKPGKNVLKLELCNSNRNLLGPHHFADPEPYALGPVTFSLENMWHDGKCDLFTDRYAFVRYGADVSIK